VLLEHDANPNPESSQAPRREKMPKFEPGEGVAVPATVQQGAFPGESLVTISTNSGQVSGFVRERDFVEVGKTVRAIVRESTTAILAVQLSGSYFTTNGLAQFSADWANKNVRAIA
jgi:hypothetical protein